jgi:DNA polymerase-3 subunit epsilon
MWWTGAALGFDLETDSADPTDARIITAANVLITPGNEPIPMEVMLQPERDIPDGAVAVHGITTETARELGALREMGIGQIAGTIAEIAGPEIPIVGHNASFDLTILDREMRRTGIGRLDIEAGTGFVSLCIGGDQVAAFPVIDTYVIDKAVDRYRKGSRKLEAAAAHYGVPMTEGSAHDAAADVFAALRIAFRFHQRGLAAADYVAENGADPMAFRMHPFMRHYAGRRDPLELVKSFAALAAMSLPELHAAQVRWAREQADGLREYFISKGQKDDAATVDGTWPLRTLTDGASEVETVITELI